MPPPERPRGFDLHAAPPRPRLTPLALTATVFGAISVVLLVLSLGVGFPLCSVLSLTALLAGRRAKHRPAVVLGWIGIGAALVAAIVWAGLDASGFTAEELRTWLDQRRESIRQNAR